MIGEAFRWIPCGDFTSGEKKKTMHGFPKFVIMNVTDLAGIWIPF